MNNALKNLLGTSSAETKDEILLALREAMQSIALLGLWRARFFEHAAFYGGTALRLLYGLDRFSEDLYFSLIHTSEKFSFYKYSASIKNELNSFGFEVSFETKKKTADTDIESAFLKANTYNQLLLIEAPPDIISGIDKHQVLKIKLEVDTNPPSGADTEMKYVFSPIPFAVRTFTLPSLFAGKMHALLYRRWKTRVKGRDWYDFVWYISRYPKLNLHHLEERMRQSGDYIGSDALTKNKLLELIYNVIDDLNVENARKEVSPFITDQRSLDIWSKDFFKAAAEKIVID
jgi:hypothetical protein